MKISEITFSTKTFKSMLLLAIVLIAGSLNAAFAQTTYKISPGSQIKVAGTSTLHDWTMTASTFSCEGVLVVKDGVLRDINSMNFSLPVVNLKSKEKLMDTRAYKALKQEKFDRISFKLTDATVMTQQKVKVNGNLTIGGVTKAISFISSYTEDTDGSITFKGSKAFKMSDHNIVVPSFMLGAMKTGDAITVELSLKMKK